MSSWLRDFFLEGLGFEIREIPPRDVEAAAAARRRTTNKARLVQVLGWGNGCRFEREICRDHNGRNKNPARVVPRNDRWNVNSRGKSPNLAIYTDTWILVSDGSHSARAYLTVEALKEFFDLERNNTEDNRFGHGYSVILKEYSLVCDVDNNENAAIGHRSLGRGVSVQLKVSSLEPKPGFIPANGIAMNEANHNDKNRKAILRPVMEETEVLYGLHFIAQQTQQQMRNISFVNIFNTPINNPYIGREWDIVFGCLSEGCVTIATTSEDNDTVIDGNRRIDDILELADKISSSDKEMKKWQNAKTEFVIPIINIAANDNVCYKTQKPMSAMAKKPIYEHDRDLEDNDQNEEDFSRMYIQNVLASSDEEDSKSKNGKFRTSKEEYESNNDDSRNSDSERHVPSETHPTNVLPITGSTYVPSIQTEMNGAPSIPSKTAEESEAAGIKRRGNSKYIALKNMKADDDSQFVNGAMVQMQQTQVEKKDEGNTEPTMNMTRKRPRGNTFENGIAYCLSLDGHINALGNARSSTKQMRRRKQQQLMLHQQEERLFGTTGVWESIKEQLFEPGRAVLYCVPFCRMPSVNDTNNEEKIFFTPQRSLTTIGAASTSTNLTSSTHDPSSGAYYRKYGLARWLSQNMIGKERG